MMDDGVKIRVTEPGIMGDEPIEEFETFGTDTRRVVGGVGNLVGQVVRLQIGLITLPLNLLPAKSRYHAKNSIREGYMAIKTLIDDVTGGIEEGLNRTLERDRLRADLNNDTIPPAHP